jgi:hypothetical protein
MLAVQPNKGWGGQPHHDLHNLKQIGKSARLYQETHQDFFWLLFDSRAKNMPYYSEFCK